MESDYVKVAKLEARTQLQSQVLSLVADPLWSSILGFVAVHELRKKGMIGPVADDVLYAGIIAINTGRSPGLTDLAGKGISAAGAALAGGAAAVGTVGTVAAGKAVLSRVGGRAAGVALLPVGVATSMAAAELKRKGYLVEKPQIGSAGPSQELY